MKMKVGFKIMFPRTVLFNVWSAGQQHQLHLGDHEKYFLGPTPNLLRRKEGREGERETGRKEDPPEDYLCMLKFENQYPKVQLEKEIPQNNQLVKQIK